jgi:tRNA 2-thiouridine synthesizing protein A
VSHDPTEGRADEPVTELEVDLELDCRGARCPQPVIDLARRIGEVPVGGVVAVLTTDVAARTDIPAWCRMRGQEYLGAAPDGPEALRQWVRRTS